MQATLHRALTRRGMEVTAVGDGRAALSQWTALQPDAVILDLTLPGHAVTKERLYELVFPGQLDVQYEAIEVVVYRLRKKLAGTGLTLMTLRGLGYLLRADT